MNPEMNMIPNEMYDMPVIEDDMRRPPYGRRPFGYHRPFGYGFGYGRRPFGVPFLGGFLGGLAAGALFNPYPYPYGRYPFYGYPYYGGYWF